MDHMKDMVKKDSEQGFEYSSKHLLIDLIFGAVLLGIYAGAIYYYEPFKHAEGFGANQGKMSFEVKRAKDVDQRLADVKGITEIKNEIEDVIRMIKNTDDYT
jgi:ATP-dependent Zn protease